MAKDWKIGQAEAQNRINAHASVSAYDAFTACL